MPQLKIAKYHGTGNDFILIDSLNNPEVSIEKKDIVALCRRRFGVGADGLIILKKSQSFDFKMDYYNADGSGATMCGNGGRCIVAFARRQGLDKENFTFEAADGIHYASIDSKDHVSLKMTDVQLVEMDGEAFVCHTGSPHYVAFGENLETMNVRESGRRVRYSSRYSKEGINVNFVQAMSDRLLCVRTYERGVEDETLACGTGAVASCIAQAERTNVIPHAFEIQTRGGSLRVRFQKNGEKYENIYLEGPASFVFETEIELPLNEQIMK